MTELLAPAGDIDSGYAAFAYGADAVYLGLSQFSARAEAANFSPDEFLSFTAYAHSLNKKIYVAVNTVFFESEVESMIDTLNLIDEAGADGVIVQDIGVGRLINKYFPALRPHASTQLAVHNREGVEALRDIGVKRVVLARELTLDEIRDICKVPGIEKEVFIHGALCYSYSGLCQFSSVYTGRSANRGKCVYPCRELFKAGEQEKHIFSMKDLALGEDVSLLTEAGVSSLKIEGRKKSPLYVAAVTDYYRSILDGEKDRKILEEKRARICSIFSRPATGLYLKNRRNYSVVDTEIVGHRGLALGNAGGFTTRGGEKYMRFKAAYPVSRYDGIQVDLPKTSRPFGFSAESLKVKGKNVFKAGQGAEVEVKIPENAPFIPEGAAVYLASSSEAKGGYPFTKPKENQEFKIGRTIVSVSIGPGRVTASAEGAEVSAEGDFPAAKSVETSEKSIRDAFAKTGGTGLILKRAEISNPDGLFVPLSVLNDLRRRLYELVSEILRMRKTKEKQDMKDKILAVETPVVSGAAQTEETYLMKTDDIALLQALEPEDRARLSEIVFEFGADTDLADFDGFELSKLRWALPTVARAWEMAGLKKKIDEILAAGMHKFEIGNFWGLGVLKKKPADIAFDWPIYIANASAARAALELGTCSVFTVSPETPEPDALFKGFPMQATAVIYQDVPLFISETCPYAALAAQCENCGGNREEMMMSRYGTFISVMKNCRHFLLNERPRLRKKEAANAGAKRMRIDFMHRRVPAEERIRILRKLLEK